MHYEDMIGLLFERVPEYAATRSGWDNSETYDVFGGFGLYLVRCAREPDTDPSVLRRSFSLLNEMLETADEKIRSLAIVGVLEVLTDTEESTALAQRFLSSEGRAQLDACIRFWRTPPNPGPPSHFN